MKTDKLIETAKQFRFYYHGPSELDSLGIHAEFLNELYEKTKDMTFPGSYGQSPFDDAFALAYMLKHGVSQTRADYLRRNRHEHDVRNQIACIEHLGMTLPPFDELEPGYQGPSFPEYDADGNIVFSSTIQ